MIELIEFKKALGTQAKELSEEQILELREKQDQMAEIFIDMWVKKNKIKEIKV